MMHVRDLIGTFRAALFGLLFVGMAILAFYCNGFCATISGADLQKRFEVIAKAANGKVGVAVELLETQECITLNGQERFPMQSVYKLPIGMAVLQRVDEGTLNLEQLIQVTTNDFVTNMQHSPIRDAHPLGAELSVSNLLRH